MRLRGQIRAAVASLALAGWAVPSAAQQGSEPPAVEPEAKAALERMGETLRGLQGFLVRADTTHEQVRGSGEKIQYSGTTNIALIRPNKFRVSIASDRESRDYLYDGRSVTVFSPAEGTYATFDAPATIREALALAAQKYGIEIPLADLFRFGSDPEMIAKLTSGFSVGTETIGGNACEHFAFRQEGSDWQLWVRKEGQALPCKLVITTTDDDSRPQYAAQLLWETSSPDPTTFTFRPPQGAQRIGIAAREQ